MVGGVLGRGARRVGVPPLQEALSQYGYGLTVSGTYDSATHDVVTAFQRHFRQERIDGIADESTRATLRELLAQRGRIKSIAARARDFGRLAS
jgi:N-acetylmuramoyl-L-alanine amidase